MMAVDIPKEDLGLMVILLISLTLIAIDGVFRYFRRRHTAMLDATLPALRTIGIGTAFQIGEQITLITGHKPGPEFIFPTLAKMESEGKIVSLWAEPIAGPGSVRQRLYAPITKR